MIAMPVETTQDFSLGRLAELWAFDHLLVTWRHDVDYNLRCAVEMAEAEAEHGIQSTYYIRSKMPGAAPGTAKFRAAVKDILRYGHHLGTHADLELPRNAMVGRGLLASCCQRERALLADFPVENRVSFHAPPVDALWRTVPRFEHAMEPQWGGRYLADSRGVLRGDPEAMLADGVAVQINLHAEWWFLPPREANRLRRREALAP